MPAAPQPVQSSKVAAISGDARVPGDKSMSHRAIMFGAMTPGETRITGLLEGQDVLNTAAAMRALGGSVVKGDDGIWRCSGYGVGGLREPANVIDLGNSGTSARLLMGLVAGYPFTTMFTGDASLIKRPMKRVITPLEEMGASFIARQDSKFPLAVRGNEELLSIEYETPVASAQVKSAILLAGLMARGETAVIENAPTRDHTENMLAAFGAKVKVENAGNGKYISTIQGHPELHDCTIDIPADPSSAAFPAAAAALHPGCALILHAVGINERRTGFYTCLEEMGVDIVYKNERVQAGEKVADIKILAPDSLNAIDVPPERVPSMIDEFPIIFVLAACANGTSRFTGLSELRVKESDRLGLMAEGLKKCGIDLEIDTDSLTIHGTGKPPIGGAFIETELDHRIAMSFLTLGTITDDPILIDDITPVGTSFPGFVDLMNDIGADMQEVQEGDEGL